MSELVPSLIPLDKGLNLQTAKLVAPAGSVLDTLNYEQVDFQGQKRIDGFVRYDGSASPAIDEYYLITTSTAFESGPGVILYNNDELFGRVVESTGVDTELSAIVIDANRIPIAGDVISYYDNSLVKHENTVISCIKGVDSGLTADEHYANLLEYSNTIKQYQSTIPGPVAGLHWFRDRLYAVAGVTVISLEGTTPTIYPNDILEASTQQRVLDAITLDNTRLVFLDDMFPENWEDLGDFDIPRIPYGGGSESVGTIANGYEPFTASQDIATFFESRDEAQGLEAEDGPTVNPSYGWKFVHLGWSVNFEDGISLFGSLPSLNQNITGLGVQGPTDISGNNGVPLILTQKVNLTNGVDQVNGWKSSQTPTTYELETDNLIDDDDDTIYADAYISWNGVTSEVVGITDPLVEYPATNSVVVEV
jgi:hypothetical protein